MDLIVTPPSQLKGTAKDGWVATCHLKNAIFGTTLYSSIVYISYMRAWGRYLWID